ncbi:GPI mannosyltransferase 1 isoform X1 [Alosa sapidissima]|uniref:GPI mannosyltransferase 1 isoform X1 n=2 Tax=Alosa sapidissima TaxID=34773 RepID=UPI001C0993ED|nr:GPI mannosyltransferase 1 isoform X1 [Alosa sapidissima]
MAFSGQKALSQLMRMHTLLSFALVMRLLLVGFGIYQDRTMIVKYTDIDYHVFTDASRYLTQGESPYNRSTYRYTPLLAWMLTPNIYLTFVFGKLLFVACDVLTGVLIQRLLLLRGLSTEAAGLHSALWLLNPLPAGVSTRGNAESLLSALVLGTLLCLERRRTLAAALLYGLAVHMKIYPVTYALPIALSLQAREPGGGPSGGKRSGTLWPFVRRLLNRDLLMFAFVSGGLFCGLTLVFYRMYGWEFLHETYLYHLTRRDIRHNFSPYFYLLYLTAESAWSPALGVAAFLPQAALLLLTSLAFHADLVLCCFLNTAIFVTFNKVCTSQYFLWYLCLLPLVIPHLTLSLKKGVGMLALWFAGQAIWLAPAYYLEFEGCDAFLLIWLAGLLFLSINTYIMVTIISHYRPLSIKKRPKTD